MEFSKNPLADLLVKASAYKKQIMIGLAVTTGLAVAMGAYSVYRKNREARAHRAWVDAFQVYSSKTFSSNAEKWQAVVQAYESAYEQNRGTSLAPFFRSFQAEGLYNMGKINEAIKTLQDAVSLIKNHELKEAYRVKLALYQLDSNTPEMVEQGLKDLSQLALQDTHHMHDFVLYQLGEYYWTTKQFDQVKNYWKMLTLKYGQSAQAPSPWASLVKDRLSLLESK